MCMVSQDPTREYLSSYGMFQEAPTGYLTSGELSLDKIQEVFVRVTALDKISGTGTVFVITAGEVYVGIARGGAPLRPSITCMSEPYKVGKFIEDAMEKGRNIRSKQ